LPPGRRNWIRAPAPTVNIRPAAGSTGIALLLRPDNIPGGDPQRVMTATNLPPGISAIFARTIVTDLRALDHRAPRRQRAADRRLQLTRRQRSGTTAALTARRSRPGVE